MFRRIADDVFLVPVYGEEELPLLRLEFDVTCACFPEFNQGAMNGEPYVLGAFGAFGNPASFHNPFVRQVRGVIHDKALAALVTTVHEPARFHQLMDRMCIRRAGTAYQGESWHRDVVSGLDALPSDRIWGGWINFDGSDQLFRCVPGSADAIGAGFARAEQPPAESQVTIKVPPGWCILFRQDILHCVIRLKNLRDSYRLFVGFRVTTSSEPLYDVMDVVTRQSIPFLPSGQKPPMFSAMHDSALLHRITIPWSEKCIDPMYTMPRIVRGEPKFVVPRFFRMGLDFYGAKYPEYSPEEIEVLLPRTITI